MTKNDALAAVAAEIEFVCKRQGNDRDNVGRIAIPEEIVQGWAATIRSTLAQSEGGEAVAQINVFNDSVDLCWAGGATKRSFRGKVGTHYLYAHPAKAGGDVVACWPAGYDLFGLAGALRHQRQCDDTGEMCIVSRQAADEAASIIEKLANKALAPSAVVPVESCPEHPVEWQSDCARCESPHAECECSNGFVAKAAKPAAPASGGEHARNLVLLRAGYNVALPERNDALDAGIAALSTLATRDGDDAARLSWLESNEAALVSHREPMGEDEYGIWWQVCRLEKAKGSSISGHPLGNVRDAIDAAIDRARDGGGE